MARYSNWSEMIKYLNNRDDEYEFTPLDIKKHLHNNSITINSYVRILMLHEYINRVDRGLYKLNKEIPCDLLYTKAKKYAYMTPEQRIRLQKIKKIKNKIKIKKESHVCS